MCPLVPQADLGLVTDWLYRPADSLESQLARTVLSSLDWAEGGLLSYDQHVTTAVTVVEAAMAHSCQGTYVGNLRNNKRHFDWPIGPTQWTNQRSVGPLHLFQATWARRATAW